MNNLNVYHTILPFNKIKILENILKAVKIYMLFKKFFGAEKNILKIIIEIAYDMSNYNIKNITFYIKVIWY